MPRYVTTGGQFNPMSYDELAKPLEQAAAAHIAANEAMDDLAVKAGEIGSQIGDDPARNRRLRAMYEGYASALKAAQDALYSKGYTASTARSLSDARRRYASDMLKVRGALDRWNARVDEYRKAKEKDRTLLSSRDPYMDDVDAYLDGTQRDVESYSGATLASQAATAAAELRRELAQHPEYESILGGKFYQEVKRNGFSGEQIDEAARTFASYLDGTGSLHTDGALAMLENAMKKVWESSGVGGWADADTRGRAVEYIAQGMYPSIGDVQYGRFDDPGYIDPYKAWLMRPRDGGNDGGKNDGGAGEETMRFEPLYWKPSGDKLKAYRNGWSKEQEDDVMSTIEDMTKALAIMRTQGEAGRLMDTTKKDRKDPVVYESVRVLKQAEGALRRYGKLGDGQTILDATPDMVEEVIRGLTGAMDENVKEYSRYMNAGTGVNQKQVAQEVSARAGIDGTNVGDIAKWGASTAGGAKPGGHMSAEDFSRIVNSDDVRMYIDQWDDKVVFDSLTNGQAEMDFDVLKHFDNVTLDYATVASLYKMPGEGEKSAREAIGDDLGSLLDGLVNAAIGGVAPGEYPAITLDGETAARLASAVARAGTKYTESAARTFDDLFKAISRLATGNTPGQAQTGGKRPGEVEVTVPAIGG